MSAAPLPPATGPVYAPPSDCLVVTTPYVPGYRIVRVVGATFGLIVRSRGLGQNIVAALRSLWGGEIKEYTQLLELVRHESLQRLCEHAKSLGANAVVSVSFDTSEIGQIMTEVLAFGTAVVVELDPTGAAPVSLR